MREPRAGDMIQAWPAAFERWANVPHTLPGKIIYVNRRHRYYQVEFQVSGQTIRESYKFDDGVMYR